MDRLTHGVQSFFEPPTFSVSRGKKDKRDVHKRKKLRKYWASRLEGGGDGRPGGEPPAFPTPFTTCFGPFIGGSHCAHLFLCYFYSRLFVNRASRQLFSRLPPPARLLQFYPLFSSSILFFTKSADKPS